MKTIQKVILVNPSVQYAKEVNEATAYPPIGLAYIASFLESKGISCKIIDANLLRLNNKDILKRLIQLNPDLVGITTNIVTVKESMQLSRQIKANLQAKVAIGGPYASSLPEKALKDSQADCIVLGEGERTFCNLIKHDFDLKNTNGVAYFENNNTIKINPREDPIKNLDELTFPAYHLLPPLKLYKSRSRKSPVAPILTSRGCPYQCIYCNKNIFGSLLRKRSPENIIAEIEMLVKKYGVKQIDVLDDNFTFDNQWAETVLDLIIRRKFNLTISFPNGVRADSLTKELVHKMKLAGTYRCAVGVESGDKEILKNIKKNLDLDKVKQAIKWFRQEGISVSAFFMLGLPGDTPASMKKTIDFAIEANPQIANFAITVPLPGTELYDMLKSKGLITKPVEEGLSTGYYTIGEGYYEFEGLTREQVLKYQRMAYRNFYFRASKILEILTSIKTIDEFKWLVSTAWPLVKGIFWFKK